MEFNHYSVLLNETIENLNIKPDGIYVDGTLGGGGHAYQVASRLSEKGRHFITENGGIGEKLMPLLHSRVVFT